MLEASQQVLIEALPHILVLHMKRFCYDTGVAGVVKVGKQVRYSPELEIGNGGFLFFLFPFGEGVLIAELFYPRL